MNKGFEMAHRLLVCLEYMHPAINDAASCRKRRTPGWTTRWCCRWGRCRHHRRLPRGWRCHRLEAMWCNYIGVMPLCEPYTPMATLNMQERRTPSSSMHTRRFIRPCMYSRMGSLKITRRLVGRYRPCEILHCGEPAADLFCINDKYGGSPMASSFEEFRIFHRPWSAERKGTTIGVPIV